MKKNKFFYRNSVYIIIFTIIVAGIIGFSFSKNLFHQNCVGSIFLVQNCSLLNSSALSTLSFFILLGLIWSITRNFK